MKTSIFRLSVLLAVLLPMVTGAQIFVPDRIIPPSPIPIPRPHWPTPSYHWAPMEISSTKITAKIRDSIATTSVEVQLHNPNSQQIEGSFLFPVPKGAQLDKFTMDIDGKPVEAEWLDSAKARGIYEDIVRRMKDPALLEYAGRDMFKVRVFPIPGHGKKRITLSYTQVLKKDSGLVSYVYPLNTVKFSAAPLKNVSVKLEIDSAQPLKSIYSPSHTVEVHRTTPRHATVGFEASDVRPDADFEVLFMPQAGDVSATVMTYKSSGEEGYFLLLASPGVDVRDEKIVAKDVTFVLDTSGSMAGNKLNQAKKAFQFCVENLNDNDRFELIRFSTDVDPLFHQLVAASNENRQKANHFIKDLKPTGSTDIHEALKQALALRPKDSTRPYVVIFLTDGQPTVGETDNEKIIAHVKEASDGHARIFCFGIGNDVNTHMLDRIAEETGANGQYVLPEEDIGTKVSSFFAKIKEPVLSNPKLDFSDIRVSKLYPPRLPDLFKGDQLVVVGRYAGGGAGKITLEGTVNGKEQKFKYPAQFDKDNSEHDFIPRLWATRRVGYLLDQIRLHGETSESKEEVTELARKYGIVTPFTAGLIVEDEKRRDVPVASRSLQNLDKDRIAQKEAIELYSDFKTKSSGNLAIQSSRQGGALRSADNAAQAMDRSAAIAPGVLSGSSSAVGTLSSQTGSGGGGNLGMRLREVAQQNRFVNGRSFFQNGNQWTDAEVQNHLNQKPVRIQFNSKEYFAFAEKNPQARPWLALGQNVQFVMGNTVYEVYE